MEVYLCRAEIPQRSGPVDRLKVGQSGAVAAAMETMDRVLGRYSRRPERKSRAGRESGRTEYRWTDGSSNLGGSAPRPGHARAALAHDHRASYQPQCTCTLPAFNRPPVTG